MVTMYEFRCRKDGTFRVATAVAAEDLRCPKCGEPGWSMVLGKSLRETEWVFKAYTDGISQAYREQAAKALSRRRAVGYASISGKRNGAAKKAAGRSNIS